MDVEAKVIAILADKTMSDPLDMQLGLRLDALDLDSLTLVETIFALEEAFDITFPIGETSASEHSPAFTTVGEIVQKVQMLLAKNAA